MGDIQSDGTTLFVASDDRGIAGLRNPSGKR